MSAVAVHPTDAALGAKLVAAGVVFCLACNEQMQADTTLEFKAICDPAACGAHSADVRLVAAGFRRFDIPTGDTPSCVWVIPETSRVPGVIHRST